MTLNFKVKEKQPCSIFRLFQRSDHSLLKYEFQVQTHTCTHSGCPSRSFAKPVHWLFWVENNTKQQTFTIYRLQVSHHGTGMIIKLNLHRMYHTRLLCLTERKGSVFSISPKCVGWLLQFYWTAVLCTAYLEHNVDAKECPTGNKRKHGSIFARHSVRFLPRIL